MFKPVTMLFYIQQTKTRTIFFALARRKRREELKLENEHFKKYQFSCRPKILQRKIR